MSINGIWKIEILGLYDWEPFSTTFLHDGRYRSGSADHYTVGSYETDGNKIVADVTVVMHGKVRTLFGKKATRHELHLEGEVSGDTLKGTAAGDEGVFLVTYRGTKLADLP